MERAEIKSGAPTRKRLRAATTLRAGSARCSAERTADRSAERTAEPTAEEGTLQTLLWEVRELRSERAQFLYREEQLMAQLRRGAEDQRNTGQSFANFVSRDFPVNNCGIRLKPDTFDGGAPLREFLIQFNLIARANRWDDSIKAVALASSLRGKARAVLDGLEEAENLNFVELEGRLRLRFGDEYSGQSFYSLFTNRKQKFGEDLPTFGADLERLSRLAYPECSYEVRDKIACAQFVTTLSDGFIKRTLQLEGVTSLRKAIERSMAVKAIQENSFSGKKENFGRKFGFEKGEKDFSEKDKKKRK